jgi:hypothetical protein
MALRSTKIFRGVLVAALAVFGASGCGSGSAGTSSVGAATTGGSVPGPRAAGSGKPAVTIGTKNFTEDMKEMGVGLAAAVLIDATIVRGVLLPATMKLLGDWNWYLPRWLEWLPRVDHGSQPVADEEPGAVPVHA